MKKTAILVGDPQIPGSVLSDGMHYSARKAAYGNKPIILHVADPATRGDPNSPAIILKKRIWVMSVQFASASVVPGRWLCAAPGRGAALAENRNLPVIPSVQALIGAKPNASIPSR
jgi:hypothetical protein